MQRVKVLLIAVLLASATSTTAVDLEVTHLWTSGGDAAAVSQFAKALNEKTSHRWVDGAIAGAGGAAIPIIISRILGGDPMAATQLNHGRQSEELIEAGLMTDLTSVADRDGWRDLVNPPALLDACTFEGRIYCVPVNIHSTQWLWLSHAAFDKAGVAVPSNWDEFAAAAPALEKAGILPLAMGQQGWQQSIAVGTLEIALAGLDAWRQVNIERNAEIAAGPIYAGVFESAAKARDLARNSKIQDWNLATNLVITDKAGGQIMGDWAQGEFQLAGEVAGKDYSCLPGLGVNAVLDTGGDAFYFPEIDDPEIKAAQLELASLLMSPEVQVAFNLAKGSLPVRSDIDMSAANECMQKGMEILRTGGVLPSADMNFTPDTTIQLEELMAEFWSTDMSPADAQVRYASIIDDAD